MPIVPRRTKIVATIGPASSEPAVLKQLMGMIDGARLNFSHGTHEDHRARAEAIRALQDEVGQPGGADRRPAGAEAPRRRARRARRCSSVARR